MNPSMKYQSEKLITHNSAIQAPSNLRSSDLGTSA